MHVHTKFRSRLARTRVRHLIVSAMTRIAAGKSRIRGNDGARGRRKTISIRFAGARNP